MGWDSIVKLILPILSWLMSRSAASEKAKSEFAKFVNSYNKSSSVRIRDDVSRQRRELESGGSVGDSGDDGGEV